MSAVTNVYKEIDGITIEQFLQYLKSKHPLAVLLNTDNGTIVDPAPEKIEKRIKFLKYDLQTIETALEKAQHEVSRLTTAAEERRKTLELYK